MVPSRTISRLPLAGLLAVVAATLAWLLFGFANDRMGWVALPNAEATVEFLPGRGDRLTRAEVERLPADSWRRRRDDARGPLGAVRSELWLRVTLRNPGPEELRGVLADSDFFADYTDAWVQEDASPGGGARGWRELRSGEAIPMKEKALWGREIAFPITVPAGGERVIYLRGRDLLYTEMQPGWWPRQADFHAMQAKDLLAEGLYLGGLLALLGYNLVLWLRLRLPDIRCYVLYLGSVASFMVLARSHETTLGWALGSPWLEVWLTLMLALGAIFLTEFARVFLELKERSPRVDGLVRVVRTVLLVLGAGAFTTPWTESMMMMSLVVQGVGLTHLTLLGVGLWAWRAGVRQARFFVASFGCLFAGSLPLVVVWLWDVKLKNAAMMGLMIGSALEMLVLSLAVADRFAQAQREKAAAQQRLVEETEQRRAIEEAYADELAVEVRERTRELEEANADKDRMLTVIGHDLRGPLAGLTQSAEQLTAAPGTKEANAAAVDRAALEGFVGDAAKLGRQVLLLIEDLVLWARLRTGAARAPARHPVRAIVAPVVALHRTMADQRGIKLTVVVADDLRVATDLVLAQTLLRNLVANALKFARSEVLVNAERAECEGGGVRLTVRDDGPGLPPAVMTALAGGGGAEAGLGLRLCAEIGRALGVELKASLVAGGGTEFEFILPAAGVETGDGETG